MGFRGKIKNVFPVKILCAEGILAVIYVAAVISLSLGNTLGNILMLALFLMGNIFLAGSYILQSKIMRAWGGVALIALIVLFFYPLCPRPGAVVLGYACVSAKITLTLLQWATGLVCTVLSAGIILFMGGKSK